MNDNPYAMSSAVSAAESAVTIRAAFLRKTYSTLLAGILGWCVTMWCVKEVPAVQQVAFAIAQSWILSLALMFGGAWLVHSMAERKPINVVLYAAYVVLFGLLIGPWVMIAEARSGASIVAEAGLITGLIFVGLTAYVFISGKDFSFMGGALTIGLVALLAIGIASWAFGFQVGIWYSVAVALLFSGYILYDTSRILHHYPPTAHIAAAAVLFVDVVLLFKHILVLLMSRDD
jgi:FtsH-binding integral membrane protein